MTPATSTSYLYPEKPAGFGKCRLIINEIVTSNHEKISFIEHYRVCPKEVSSSKSTSLTGFVEIIIETGETMRQISFADFIGKDFTVKNEGRRQSYYFTVGTDNSAPNMKLSEASLASNDHNAIPTGIDKTLCIILLHIFDYKQSSGQSALNSLKLLASEIGWNANSVNDERMNIIKKYYQDVVIIGEPCSTSDCGFCFDLLVLPPQVEEINELHLPVPEISPEAGIKPYLSINRCTNNQFPLQQDSFTPGRPSPGSRNNCPVVSRTAFPFNFRGSTLQSSAQKLIVNVRAFFEGTGNDPIVMDGTSNDKVSQATGVHLNTVKKVLQNWKNNAISTPGLKRSRKSPVMEQFDTFRVEHVKRVIAEYYARNIPPLLSTIFNDLVAQIREEENGRRLRGETFTPFHCSLYTFRKLLHKIGFKFGKINNRDVILQRPDIVARRYEYLSAMRHNRRLDNPKPVIYTDETWIDPFARTGKAWVLRKSNDYRERSQYTYQKNKCGRGPRIIVLHAGDFITSYIHSKVRMFHLFNRW